jgi:hypothetical protein
MSVSQSIRALLLAPDDSPPAPTKGRAPSLLSDERGATMVMGVFMAAMLVGMIYYVWGIGGTVVHRERLQDAADTAVFGAAVIEARGMNLIALMNVIMLVLAIIGTAFLVAKEIVLATAIAATVDCVAKFSCCWATGCCIEPCIDAADHWMDYDDISGDSDDWNDRVSSAISGINTVANGVRRGAPVAAQGLVLAYGQLYQPSTDFGLADIVPLVTTLAAENDDSHWPCGNDSVFFGVGESGTPLVFGAAVGVGALVLSAAATDTDAHYLIGVATGGPLGWLAHQNEYCDGDPDSFLRVPEDDWLGEEPFQVRAGMHGAPPFTWTVEGVAVANWGRSEGTTSFLGGIDPALANSIAIAQAEYYWEDEDGDVKQEWMFEPRWRARLRRTRLNGMGGPLGALVNVIATVLDPVMIH